MRLVSCLGGYRQDAIGLASGLYEIDHTLKGATEAVCARTRESRYRTVVEGKQF